MLPAFQWFWAAYRCMPDQWQHWDGRFILQSYWVLNGIKTVDEAIPLTAGRMHTPWYTATTSCKYYKTIYDLSQLCIKIIYVKLIKQLIINHHYITKQWNKICIQSTYLPPSFRIALILIILVKSVRLYIGKNKIMFRTSLTPCNFVDRTMQFYQQKYRRGWSLPFFRMFYKFPSYPTILIVSHLNTK